MLRSLTPLVSIVLATGCAGPSSSADPRGPFPLLPELAGAHLPISTHSSQAQSYFDQGLTLYWSFDHEEAIRSFRRAAELDPSAAMPYWGIALASGPHINNPTMDPEREQTAHEAMQALHARLEGLSELESGLIEALGMRYAWPPPADRRALDEAYAHQMGRLWGTHPTVAEVGTLCAEAQMDLIPWDLFAADGTPRPETPAILKVLGRVLELDPNNVGANHLTIHAWEMSPTPEKALASADRLRTLVPGAAHLVHMPAHIDVRLGHYDAAMAANERAVQASLARVERTGSGGFYALYRAHNYHFLVYAAQFCGRSREAIDTARELLRQLPEDVVDAFPEFVEGFLPTALHVLVRFGKWDEILAEPKPPANRPSLLAFWHYARGLAYSSLGRVDEAVAEQRAFETACAAVPENYTIGNNPTSVVLDIGREMLAGEIDYRRGLLDSAFAHLREAVRRDEGLRYDEPWGWFQPAAHALGALLLEQGRLAEAEAVYRRDLELHPDNGWALFGLEECQRRAGRTAEADATEALFREHWRDADVQIRASCYCRTGAS